ncbi:zinc finger MYM-type protein 1-like [Xenopus laevis]|uniref:Zinc finger MYM-type protein 1-like n=1 Tax=Xenopus laevis TaxID=8355 RepID=A0A8J1KXS8_XENLA|nr:zinc finger MYM-type protein 1-like [Xenopus laevis]
MSPPSNSKKHKSGSLKRKECFKKKREQQLISKHATRFWSEFRIKATLPQFPEKPHTSTNDAFLNTVEVTASPTCTSHDLVTSLSETTDNANICHLTEQSEITKLQETNDTELAHTDVQICPETGEIDNIAFSTAASIASISNSEKDKIVASTDPALWPKQNKNLLQDYWCCHGPQMCRNFTGKYNVSERRYSGGVKRSFNNEMVERIMPNGETVVRSFIIYSPSEGNIFCFHCRLFSTKTTAFSYYGFSDWKHASDCLIHHENSAEHQRCVKAYIKRCHVQGRIDSEVQKTLEIRERYWKDVLRRVVATVKFLSQYGLPFRGTVERFGSPNNGVYLGSLEYLAQFDPFIAAHIEKYGNKGRGKPSYLSLGICEEMITMMGRKVQNQIVKEIISGKYYSLCVDSTPDVNHVDQLTFTVRFVNKCTGQPVERFLQFVPIHSHTGESLANTILKTLEEHKIPIKDCRGQAYDNASNMSGKYKGVKTHIQKVNPLAEYVPCSAHSLNLVGQRAVSVCPTAADFFSLVQLLYDFFSGSTHRWELLLSHLKPNEKGRVLTLKGLGDTRWSSHANAVKALFQNYCNILQCLKKIESNEEEYVDTRKLAKPLIKKLEKLENVITNVGNFATEFWSNLT